MTRAVLDPNVLISAVLSRRGAPAMCLAAHAEGRFDLILSETLMRELRGVLLRPKFRRYLSVEEAAAFIALLRQSGLLEADPTTPERVSEDPSDDYLVALARAAGAHVLVSGDLHLTKLELADLTILTPREFLRRLPD